MSQQYGAPQQPPAQGGWGPGPAGPQFRSPAKSSKTPWIVMGGAVLAVLLIAVGVVLLTTGGGKDDSAAPAPDDKVTPDPIGTMYTPEPTEAPKTKGPNDVGVEVGKGVWFTPAKGWLQGPDKTVSGQYWILQEFNKRGLIDGYFWVRQTKLYDAKAFAEHLVDIESNGFKNVRIGKGVVVECATEALKACYSIDYTADVPSKSGKLLPFKGFVTAYEDQFGQVTATDAGLESRVYDRRVNELKAMNNSVVKSYS
ncbi:hypothetical protein [Kribbella sp. CA-293567]|uniref:hypothetical protein n=1 Tax=Kribbella sp. CA-293567 TaxID=3002436 RepID=UPI0022DDF2F5|nr:hypothetical protein [Kribbella sp. CA-293567]WBQ02367.1 hypothetical protein OX958_20510 [Kribbella sp. CA-293567]